MSKRPRAEAVSKRCDNCGSLVSDGGQGGFGKDGKYHTFCSSKCRSEYIQKGPKPLQVKLTMFFEQAEQYEQKVSIRFAWPFTTSNAMGIHP